MKNDDRPRNYRKDTLLTHLGRNPEAHHGAVNPPVYHASTILSTNMAEWEAKRAPGRAFRRDPLWPAWARRPPSPSKRRWRRSRAAIARC